METYSVKEASKILQYNEEYLRRLIKAGVVKASKVGRKWIIKKEVVEEFLKE
jgi:excisionase family DNA binding protein